MFLLYTFFSNEYYKEENKLLSTVYEDISKKGNFISILINQLVEAV